MHGRYVVAAKGDDSTDAAVRAWGAGTLSRQSTRTCSPSRGTTAIRPSSSVIR
jgi:hypothetical protein